MLIAGSYKNVLIVFLTFFKILNTLWTSAQK